MSISVEEVGSDCGSLRNIPSATAELVQAVDYDNFLDSSEALNTIRVLPLESAHAPSAVANHPNNGVAASAEPVPTDVDGPSTAAARSFSPLHIPLSRNRAEFVSVSLLRSDASVLLGIKLKRRKLDGQVQISSLSPDGILAQSPLRVDDLLLSINGRSLARQPMTEISDFLHKMTGSLTIVARNVGGDSELVETMIEKPSPDARVGLAMRRSTQGSLDVTKVRPDGLFANSLLVSSVFLSVSREKCTSLLSTNNFQLFLRMWVIEFFLSTLSIVETLRPAMQ